MKKRILAAIICICVVAGSLGVPIAQASQVGENKEFATTTRWTNTATISLDMKLSSGTITSEGQILGKAGTTRISVTFTLEKLVSGKYQYVDSWTASSNSMLCSSSNKTSGCTSGTYKLTVRGTVTKDNYAEPIEDWLIKTF